MYNEIIKMISHIFIFSAFGAFFVNGVNLGPQYPPTKGEVWPKPQYEKKESTYFVFRSSQFEIKPTNYTCEILSKAIERYSFTIRSLQNIAIRSRKRRNIKRHKRMFEGIIKSNEDFMGNLKEFLIELTSPCENYPYFGMDESYDLTIDKTSTLKAASIWGILRGLESWAHLFYLTDDYTEIRINKTQILDFPRYKHRGLLLDTARHYISLDNILKTLNAMSMNKMNVFHWHIVDDQSFPYESQKFPDLSVRGAYHPTMIYSKSDVEKVISYARDRGIRVLPEFDVPGHTRSWGGAYPSILTECYKNKKVIGLGPMNPIRNSTYKLLQDLFIELQELFPDSYFHVGGDEVELDCWQSNPELQAYMLEHNFTVQMLHGFFMQKTIPLLQKKSTIVWQEVFDEMTLSNDIIVQVWKNDWVHEMVKVLLAGNKLIFSSSWYLDYLKNGGDWLDFYNADPRQMVNSLVDNSLLDNIVGGEACMWGEVVDNANVISRIWPRASAVAERLWSASLNGRTQLKAVNGVRNRIEEHTCRMNRRGIAAQPPNGPGMCLTNSQLD